MHPKFIWFTDISSAKAVHFTPYHLTTIPIHFVPIDLSCNGFTTVFTSSSFACFIPMKSYNMWNMTKCHASWSTLILNSFTCAVMVLFFPVFLQLMYFPFFFYCAGLYVSCFVSFLFTPTTFSAAVFLQSLFLFHVSYFSYFFSSFQFVTFQFVLLLPCFQSSSRITSGATTMHDELWKVR
jgi:hypothetical protein